MKLHLKVTCQKVDKNRHVILAAGMHRFNSQRANSYYKIPHWGSCRQCHPQARQSSMQVEASKASWNLVSEDSLPFWRYQLILLPLCGNWARYFAFPQNCHHCLQAFCRGQYLHHHLPRCWGFWTMSGITSLAFIGI